MGMGFHAFAQGWLIFGLQFVGLSHLVSQGGINVLPFVFLVQALISFPTYALLRRSSEVFVRKQWVWASCVGALSILFMNHIPSEKLWVASGIFLFSQILVGILRMNAQVFYSSRISLMKNPETSTQLALFEEVGFFASAAGLLARPWVPSYVASVLFFVPVCFHIFSLYMRKDLLTRTHSAHDEAVSQEKKVQPWNVAHLLSGMILIAICSHLKTLQTFGFALGFDTLAKLGHTLETTFSSVGMFQSLATMGILIMSYYLSRNKTQWSRGFLILLSAQAFGFGLIFLSAGFEATFFALTLIGSEVSRKVLEHSFYARSLQVLTGTLASNEKLKFREMVEKYGVPLGLASGGVVTMLMVLPGGYWAWLGVFGVVLAGLGIWSLKRFVVAIGDHFVAEITNPSLESKIIASQALGNPDFKILSGVLLNLLKTFPRPVLTKSVLVALGRMREKSLLAHLTPFLESPREDIQLAAVRGAALIPGHETNYALLMALKTLVRNHKNLRIQVIRALMDRLDSLSIPYLLEVLGEDVESRIKANVVQVIGEFARSRRDMELLGYVSQFLDAKHPRRLRINAIIALYHRTPWSAESKKALLEYLGSPDPTDQGAAYYAIGNLRLKSLEPLVIRAFGNGPWVDQVKLLALLYFGNEKAIGILGDKLISTEEKPAIDLLIQLSYVQLSVRRMIWQDIIHRAPESIELLHERLRTSAREYDVDREILREAAGLRGIEFNEEILPKAA